MHNFRFLWDHIEQHSQDAQDCQSSYMISDSEGHIQSIPGKRSALLALQKKKGSKGHGC